MRYRIAPLIGPSLKVSAECGPPRGRRFRYFDVASTRIARASPESGRNDARTSVPADSCSADAVCPFSITCVPESIFSGRGLFSSWISDDVARAILPVTSVVPEAEPADAACCDACPDCSCACPACRWACAWEVCCCWSACWARCCACTPSLCARCASVPALACACWASLCCFLAFSSFSCRSLRAFSTSFCAVFTCSCSRVAFFCASSARLKSASARCCSVLTGSPPCRPCCALSLHAENANNPIAAIAHAVRIAVLLGQQCGRPPVVGKGTAAPEAARMPGPTRLRNGRDAMTKVISPRMRRRLPGHKRGHWNAPEPKRAPDAADRSVTIVRSTHPEGAATYVAHLGFPRAGARRLRCPGSRKSTSVRAPVLARVQRSTVRVLAVGEIDVRVFGPVFSIAVADFQIAGGLVSAIDQLMPVSRARREPRAGAGGKDLLPFLRTEHDLALDNEKHLVFVGVKMAHRRLLSGHQCRQVHADLRQPERVSERALLAGQYARTEGLGIAGRRARFDRRGVERRTNETVFRGNAHARPYHGRSSPSGSAGPCPTVQLTRPTPRFTAESRRNRSRD